MTEQAPPAASDADQAVAPEPSEPSEPSTTTGTPERRGSSGTALLGILLITVGVFFFIGQWLNIDWGAATWPFYVIAPGLAMMAFGLTQRDGSGLTVAGSIVTMVGLVPGRWLAPAAAASGCCSTAPAAAIARWPATGSGRS